jgi:hypothetical protein
MMLMAKALWKLLVLWGQGGLSALPKRLIEEDVNVALFQALCRTLHSQNEDGSWGKSHSREETAYAIIAVNTLVSFPIASLFRSQIDRTLEMGKIFLWHGLEMSSKPDLLWIEKVSYGSRALSQSYVLAALKCSPSEAKVGPKADSLMRRSLEVVMKPYRFYMQLPMFAEAPAWCIQAALIEASLFSLRLKREILGVIPLKDGREEKYLEFIPFTWTGGASGDGMADHVLPARVAADMMAMSALIYQVDEFMESVIGAFPVASVHNVKSILEGIFLELEADVNSITSYGQTSDPAAVYHNGSTTIPEVKSILQNFICFTLGHPGIYAASPYDKRQLRLNLKAFLLAHLAQVSDNSRLRSQSSYVPVFHSSHKCFFDWVRTISADHTGGPFAFSFLLCLMSNGKDSFPSAKAKYIAEDISRHYATLCRMYNDFGSVTRDREERNLNSINFSEFHLGQTGDATDETHKEELLRLAHYERKCLDLALEQLKEHVAQKTWRVVKALCDVTDLYGQMYIVKDLTPQLNKGLGGRKAK